MTVSVTAPRKVLSILCLSLVGLVGAIRVTVSPGTLYVDSGQSRFLHCYVDVESRLVRAISWLRNGTVDVEGNGSKLLFDSSSDLAGYYQCAVRLGDNIILSKPVLVKKPVFNIKFGSTRKAVKAVVGSSAVLTCSPPSMDPPANVSWHFKGSNSSGFYRLSVGNYDKLFIPVVKQDMNGKYVCVARNPENGKEVQTQFKLNVIDQAKANTNTNKLYSSSLPLNVTLSPQRKSAFLDCSFYFLFHNATFWRHNGRRMSSVHFMLQPHIIEISEPGKYECITSNGEKNRKVVTYQVSIQTESPPSPGSLLEVKGNVLVCSVQGCPNNVWIFANGKRVEGQDGVTCAIGMEIPIEGAGGTYQCIVGNSAGWNQSTIQIASPTVEAPTTSSVTDAPTTPEEDILTDSHSTSHSTRRPPKVTLQSVSSSTIGIEFRISGSRKNLVAIKVYYRHSLGEVVSEQIPLSETKYLIKKLRPNTTYEVWLQPVYRGDGGDGGHNMSLKSRVRTRPTSLGPVDSTVTGANDNMLLGIVLGSVFGMLGLLGVGVIIVVVIRRRQTSEEVQTSQTRQQFEKAQKADGNVYSFPKGPTPCLDTPRTSVSPSPLPVKKPIILDDSCDEELALPGYASIDQKTADPPATFRSRIESTTSLNKWADDGIPDYATLNEASKIKYRRKTSSRSRCPDPLPDGVEVLDYAELAMPAGGPPPKKQEDDEVDYAEIDFSRTK